MLDHIVTENPKALDVVADVEKYLLEMMSPSDFRTGSPDSILVEIDRSMERAIASLQEAGIHDAKNLTVYEFQERVEYFKSKKPDKKE